MEKREHNLKSFVNEHNNKVVAFRAKVRFLFVFSVSVRRKRYSEIDLVKFIGQCFPFYVSFV